MSPRPLTVHTFFRGGKNLRQRKHRYGGERLGRQRNRFSVGLKTLGAKEAKPVSRLRASPIGASVGAQFGICSAVRSNFRADSDNEANAIIRREDSY
jgi:hypothetical protein